MSISAISKLADDVNSFSGALFMTESKYEINQCTFINNPFSSFDVNNQITCGSFSSYTSSGDLKNCTFIDNYLINGNDAIDAI